ncbi:hypothetical protein ZEAMMB73_Zm00001d028494 [Zea mays]|uniref:Uncharacterized protein n=1 Tax=Zea mays TaxID=4577 RepID=A0A1D6JWT3_MAIZE|nr:hypothetical protein ZEAMMB73_Zm00001d028494 [Zea mays]
MEAGAMPTTIRGGTMAVLLLRRRIPIDSHDPEPKASTSRLPYSLLFLLDRSPRLNRRPSMEIKYGGTIPSSPILRQRRPSGDQEQTGVRRGLYPANEP